MLGKEVTNIETESWNEPYRSSIGIGGIQANSWIPIYLYRYRNKCEYAYIRIVESRIWEPRNVHILIPYTMNVLPYMAKGALQV